MHHRLLVKRIYDPKEPNDGLRVLIDRLWPRGVRKSDERMDVWLKEIAPSSDLRTWFHQNPEQFVAFAEAYERELLLDAAHATAVNQLRLWHTEQPITLLYAAKDREKNHAQVLQSFILG